MSWYQKKILGDLAESVCHAHFDALGYHVEYTGIEKFAQMFTKSSHASSSKDIPSKTFMSFIHKIPDLLISRVYKDQLQSYMIEVKYRTQVNDMEELENQLLWNYRHMIWRASIVDAIGFSDDEIDRWNDDDIQDFTLIKRVKKYKGKENYINLSIIFYVLIKEPKNDQEHVYCNFATFPRWWNAGYFQFEKIGTYKSLNNIYENFNDVYFTEIKPALTKIFKS